MTKMEPTIRTKMHWERLADAAGFGYYFPFKWPVTRCVICGKLHRPDKYNHNYLITQVRRDDECPLYSICRDHGGESGGDYFDAQTGCKVSVGPSPYFMRKVISDWFSEGAYWALVLLRYAWYTVQPFWHIVRYPRRSAWYFRHKAEVDRVTGIDWLGRKVR